MRGKGCDIREETVKEWKEALFSSLSRAKSNGTSEAGLSELEELLHRYLENIRVRYNGGPPTRVRPLQFKVTDGAHPVQAKPSRYLGETPIFTAIGL